MLLLVALAARGTERDAISDLCRFAELALFRFVAYVITEKKLRLYTIQTPLKYEPIFKNKTHYSLIGANLLQPQASREKASQLICYHHLKPRIFQAELQCTVSFLIQM